MIVSIGRMPSFISQKKRDELPINNANVVRPNEKPGAWGKCEAMTQTVTAVVILNRNNPIQHVII